MAELVRCAKCLRRYRGTDDWVATTVAGVITGHLCPECAEREGTELVPPNDGDVK
jgi:hypothetical protein